MFIDVRRVITVILQEVYQLGGSLFPPPENPSFHPLLSH